MNLVKEAKNRIIEPELAEEVEEQIIEPEIVRRDELLPQKLWSPEESLKKYISQINNIPSLSKEEEFLLAKAFLENQDQKAAHKLICSHLKLVAKIALSYRYYGMPLEELMSEGAMGLMRAVEKYNPDFGFRLSTYSMWWIKSFIQDYILKSWSLVNIGSSAVAKKLFFNLKKTKERLAKINSRQITSSDYTEIANELGVSAKEVEEAEVRMIQRDVSLNAPAHQEHLGIELMDNLPDIRPTQEEVVLGRQEYCARRSALLKALTSLNQRELYILKHRRLKSPASTLDELSNKFDISKERVRQIENRAFQKVQGLVLGGMRSNLLEAAA